MADTHLIKVVLLGNSGVGKTNLALRFTEDKFVEELPSTIVVSLRPKTLRFSSGTIFKINIWDTAGQERYRSIAGMYYKDAQAAVLVFDCTYRPSFEALQDWVSEMEKKVERNDIVLVIAGNKCDLIEKEEVSLEEAKMYADSVNARFYMTSAKYGTNVNEMFIDICTKLQPEIKGELADNAMINGKKGMFGKAKGTHKLSHAKAPKKKDCC